MLSKSLKLLRRFKGLSLTEMARRVGVTKSWISEIESGKKEPTLSLLQSYAETLEIPLSSILFFSEQMQNDRAPERVRTFVSKKILAIMDYIDAQTEADFDEEDTSSPSTETVSSPQAGQP